MSVFADTADTGSPAVATPSFKMGDPIRPNACADNAGGLQPGARRSKGLRSAGVLALLCVVALLPLLALAQPAMPTINEITQEGQAESGLAETIMVGLLGGIFHNPFALGAPTTLFGYLFFAFNAFVFAVAVAWGTYGIVAGIVQTAHEGQVLGKRLNALWVPIRTVTGIGSLVPMFGGFSLAQAVMIMALGWGIAGANLLANRGMEALTNFVPLTNQSAVQGTPVASAHDLAFNLFMQQLCVRGFERAAAASIAAGAPPAAASVLRQGDFLAAARSAGANTGMGGTGRAFGTTDDPTACLAVGILPVRFTGPGNSGWETVARQFRNQQVDYAAIAASAHQRYITAFGVLQAAVIAEANQYVAQYDAFLANAAPGAAAPAIPAGRLRQLAADFAIGATGAANADGGNAQVQAVRDGLRTQVDGLGFLSLGMYHSLISEANTALNAARNSVTYHISGASPLFDPASNAPQAHYITAALRAIGRSGFSGVGAESSRDFNDLLNFRGPASPNQDGWNIGQTILNLSLGALVTGNQQPGINNLSLIDPIISAKNIGDYLMTAGSALLVMPTVVNWVGQAAARVAQGAGVAATIFGKGTPASIGGAAVAGLGTAAGFILEHSTTIGWLFLIVGAILALYIPLVPFLNWVSAMVQYVATVVQAFVAAPIWALAHMDMDEEGMGGRSEKGYVWILFVLFKPSLMVIAFFAASAMVILIGSVVTWIYLPMVANVQGNSFTGIASIVGFLLVYFIILNIIIQGSFNLVEEISDDVIGWIGGAGRSGVGKGMDKDVGGAFVGHINTRGNERYQGAKADLQRAQDAARAAATRGVG